MEIYLPGKKYLTAWGEGIFLTAWRHRHDPWGHQDEKSLEWIRLFAVTHGYPNGNLAIVAMAENGEPYSKISVNVDDVVLAKNEFVVSHDLQEQDLNELLVCGVFEDTGRRVSYGYVKNQPVFRLPGWGGEQE